jgi:pyruvate/2-oxoglutarate dehydrogenase complex dihydrolipoamide dehydrogenase (E3) component
MVECSRVAACSTRRPGLGELVAQQLADDRISVRTGIQARKARRDGGDTIVDLHDGTTVRTDVIILAAGRKPNTRTLNLGAAQPGPPGELRVDEHCRLGP